MQRCHAPVLNNCIQPNNLSNTREIGTRLHSAPWRRPPRQAAGSRRALWPRPQVCPKRRFTAGGDRASCRSTRCTAAAPAAGWRCGRHMRRSRRSGCSSSSRRGGRGRTSGRRSRRGSSPRGRVEMRDAPQPSSTTSHKHEGHCGGP